MTQALKGTLQKKKLFSTFLPQEGDFNCRRDGSSTNGAKYVLLSYVPPPPSSTSSPPLPSPSSPPPPPPPTPPPPPHHHHQHHQHHFDHDQAVGNRLASILANDSPEQEPVRHFMMIIMMMMAMVCGKNQNRQNRNKK